MGSGCSSTRRRTRRSPGYRDRICQGRDRGSEVLGGHARRDVPVRPEWVEIKGDEQRPFALAGYEVFDGQGKVKAVFTLNINGEITRNETLSGTYSVKADCTGTATYSDGTRDDQFIAPDGSELTFVGTQPKRLVTASFEPRGSAKRVGE